MKRSQSLCLKPSSAVCCLSQRHLLKSSSPPFQAQKRAWEEPSMDQYQSRGETFDKLSGPLVHTNFPENDAKGLLFHTNVPWDSYGSMTPKSLWKFWSTRHWSMECSSLRAAVVTEWHRQSAGIATPTLNVWRTGFHRCFCDFPQSSAEPPRCGCLFAIYHIIVITFASSVVVTGALRNAGLNILERRCKQAWPSQTSIIPELLL